MVYSTTASPMDGQGRNVPIVVNSAPTLQKIVNPHKVTQRTTGPGAFVPANSSGWCMLGDSDNVDNCRVRLRCAKRGILRFRCYQL